jgi:hypothetical protein
VGRDVWVFRAVVALTTLFPSLARACIEAIASARGGACPGCERQRWLGVLSDRDISNHRVLLGRGRPLHCEALTCTCAIQQRLLRQFCIFYVLTINVRLGAQERTAGAAGDTIERASVTWLLEAYGRLGVLSDCDVSNHWVLLGRARPLHREALTSTCAILQRLLRKFGILRVLAIDVRLGAQERAAGAARDTVERAHIL